MDVILEQESGRETWVERALPWASSSMMHAGFGLVVAFAVFVVTGSGTPPAAGFPVVDLPPGGLIDTGPVTKPEKGEESTVDQAKAFQNLLKTDTNGIDVFGDRNATRLTISGMLKDSGPLAEIIAPGPRGVGVGNSNRLGDGLGQLAAYDPRKMIAGGERWTVIPKVSPRARRIVYLLDHSGSMLESFDFLREEVVTRTRDLNLAQNFSVIMFSEDVMVLGPEQLQRATPEVKKDVASRLRGIRASGQNDELLEPFQKGFEKAFAMKPQIIIFLTDGNFDPRLVEAVRKLNREKVQIETIAFVQISPEAEESLKQIAQEGHGSYKFVAKQDLK